MVLDGVSAFRFLIQGSFKDFYAVFKAHFAYYGIKHTYGGMSQRIESQKNDVIVTGMYPGSIVADFFLKGKKKFDQLTKPGEV